MQKHSFHAAVSHDDVFRGKFVYQGHGLGRDNDLPGVRCGAQNACKKLQGIGVESELGLVNENGCGLEFFWQEQKGCKAHEAQGGVRELMALQGHVAAMFCPVKLDLTFVVLAGAQDEVPKEGHSKPYCAHKTVVVVGMSALEKVEYGGKIASVRAQKVCVVDRLTLPCHASASLRCTGCQFLMAAKT